jgi:Na+-driven multidrug efflux pump
MNEERRLKLNSLSNMLILTIPIFIELLLQLVVGYSDQFIMSSMHYDNAVNGITNANTIINMMINVFQVFAAAAIILITQYRGAKDKIQENKVYSTSFWFNTLLSLFITILIVTTSKFYLGWLNTPSAAMEDAIYYSMIAGGSLVFQIMATTLSSFLKANNHMKESMIINIIMNVTNILGNIILVNIFKHYDLPILGVAISSSFARILGFVLLLIVYKKKIGVKLSFKEFLNSKASLIKIIKVGGPSGGESISYQSSQIVIQLIINMIVLTNGENVGMGNIKTYASMFAMVTYMFTSAVSQAMQVVIGEQLGAGLTKDVDKKVKQTRNISLIVSVSIAIIFYFTSDYLFKIFKVTDPELLKIGKNVMLIEIALEAGRALNIVYVRALQTSGDVVFPTVSAIIFCWSVAVGGSFILGWPVFNFGVPGVWAAMALDELTRAVIFVFRWKKGKWKKFNLASN